MTLWPCQFPPEPDLTMGEQVNLAIQEAQDTCDDHGVFCCPECFDMGTEER